MTDILKSFVDTANARADANTFKAGAKAMAEHFDAETARLRAVETAARDLILTGLRLTPDGLIVRESKDRSDPHYKLCLALEAIAPLNS